MKFKIPFLTASFSLALSSATFAQGTFQNLNFEAANLPTVIPGQSGGVVTVAEGLPGWTAYIGSSQAGGIFHNDISIGAASISIIGPQWNFTPILEGSYMVFLQPQYPSGSPVPAIAQTGTVPASAMSVRFYGLAGFTVSFAGQAIPISQLDSTPNYNIYGGDISMFANQTGELRFTGGGYLDFIQFSNQQVPEPSTLGLFGLGVLLFGCRSRRT